jgi:hypothetical protein
VEILKNEKQGKVSFCDGCKESIKVVDIGSLPFVRLQHLMQYLDELISMLHQCIAYFNIKQLSHLTYTILLNVFCVVITVNLYYN